MNRHSLLYRQHPLAGRSLLELAATVMLMGILVRVAVPKYVESMKRYQLLAAAKRVVADLEYARQNARIKGTTQQVVFTQASSSYALPGMDNPNHPGAAYAVNLSTSEYPATIDVLHFGSSGNGGTIVFDMYGRPDYAGSLTIRVGSTTKVISVNIAGKATYP